MKKRENGKFVQCPVKLKTNTLEVEFDKDAFLDRFSVITYTIDGRDKAISYERFLEAPYLSVFGCWDRWEGKSYRKFFVLTERKNKTAVLKCLSNLDFVRCCEDDLEEYEEMQVKRIVTSLALNALSADYAGSHRIFSNGTLMVWDDNNFTIRMNKDRNPMVGLDIELNKFMNLVASTITFWKVNDTTNLKKYWNDTKRLFKLNMNETGGFTIVPYSLKKLDLVEKEKNLYEKRSLFKRNVVPFWPISSQKYKSGKMVVLWNIVKQLNETYQGMLSVKFKEYENMVLDKNQTKEDSMQFMKEILSGKTILIDDTIQSNGSRAYVEMMVPYLKEEYPYVNFVTVSDAFDCKIKLLCGMEDNNYSKGNVLSGQTYVTQHFLFEENAEKKNDTKEVSIKSDVPKLRRIMLELSVKLATYQRKMSEKHTPFASGWSFYQFKQVKGQITQKDIVGGKLTVNEDGSMTFNDFTGQLTIKDFCGQILRLGNNNCLDTKREHHIAERNGNMYLIVCTDETPMMDVDSIEFSYDMMEEAMLPFENVLSAYKEKAGELANTSSVEKFAEDQNLIVNEMIKVADISSKVLGHVKKLHPDMTNPFKKLVTGEPTYSMFKRKDNKETMLGGYQGIHTWDREGLNNDDGAFSYMVGTNSENIQLKSATVLDKVPHTYGVFPLKITSPDHENDDRQSILGMLSHGFGRWNEAMCYPFPFKFLNEHLERMALENFSNHWDSLKEI